MSGIELSPSQVAQTKAILSSRLRVRFESEVIGKLQFTAQISVRRYLKKLCTKLWPILMSGGVRLTGSCASSVALESSNSLRPSDIDITILVSKEVDFNHVLYHQQQILLELLPEEQLNDDPTIQPILLDKLRINSPNERWSLFSFGDLGMNSPHVDIRVVHMIPRSFVFAHDSMEVVLDPLLVKGMSKHNMAIFSRYGVFSQALEYLKNKDIVMPHPEQVRNGLFRYCMAVGRGFSVKDPDTRASLETVLVNQLFAEVKSLELMKCNLRKMAERHYLSDSPRRLENIFVSVVCTVISTEFSSNNQR